MPLGAASADADACVVVSAMPMLCVWRAPPKSVMGQQQPLLEIENTDSSKGRQLLGELHLDQQFLQSLQQKATILFYGCDEFDRFDRFGCFERVVDWGLARTAGRAISAEIGESRSRCRPRTHFGFSLGPF